MKLILDEIFAAQKKDFLIALNRLPGNAATERYYFFNRRLARSCKVFICSFFVSSVVLCALCVPKTAVSRSTQRGIKNTKRSISICCFTSGVCPLIFIACTLFFVSFVVLGDLCVPKNFEFGTGLKEEKVNSRNTKDTKEHKGHKV